MIEASGPPLGLPAISIVRSADPPRVRVTLASQPRVRPQQQAVLMLGARQCHANHRAAAGDPLVFDFPRTLAADDHYLRLRVDGVDSELVLQAPGQAPAFDPDMLVTVPP